ncbi:A/G-specific adenine glycosylase [Allobacillus sp. GCM10007491]|uniref:Adenine DNA glycosylase n=1 Tax=Allobacillus saliphilus TaxID=2912308 RepID=A0A941CV76_9BACI|nr:A/G-specific adenine glycosylase [Allobacillus saliphilus]MBR7554457.1 A/G-specific adenine glycosylase [Allobacillus saliphilus]
MNNASTTYIPENFDKYSFQQDLINWYQSIRRELPWRENQDPYRIWVSEIMLQQTRVDTVIPYFNQFMERFPTVKDLANADEQDVLKAWEGLGYYSRARNLHTAVKEVVATYDGQIPSESSELKKLKGIGPYTLGAIMSIAFDEPIPAVDGNVMRVMSRIFEMYDNIADQKSKKKFEQVVEAVISKEDPSSFNQGLMELGALICSPKKPKCNECPVSYYCTAFSKGIQEELPVKTKAKKQRTIAYFAMVIEADGQYLIQKRPAQGLLANLWQFPLVEQAEFPKDEAIHYIELEYGLNLEMIHEGKPVKHVFSHVIWVVYPIFCRVSDGDISTDHGQFVTLEDMDQYPLSKVQHKIKQQIATT